MKARTQLWPCIPELIYEWYSDVMQASEIRIIKGRLKFNDGQNSAPFPSVIVVWGTPTTPKLSYQEID